VTQFCEDRPSEPEHTATQKVDLVNFLSVLLGNESKLKVSANWIVYKKTCVELLG